MRLFHKLFGRKIINMTDVDLGEVEVQSKQGNHVTYSLKRRCFEKDMEVIIKGNQDGISEVQKSVLSYVQNNEAHILSQSEKALKKEYENADMEFETLEKHFTLSNITIEEEGFELSFQENDTPYYYFNVLFMDYKVVGVSIDG